MDLWFNTICSHAVRFSTWRYNNQSLTNKDFLIRKNVFRMLFSLATFLLFIFLLFTMLLITYCIFSSLACIFLHDNLALLTAVLDTPCTCSTVLTIPGHLERHKNLTSPPSLLGSASLDKLSAAVLLLPLLYSISKSKRLSSAAHL